jgi:hypothetical protein
MADKKKEGHKDKFDENIEREGMGTVDKEGESEETGMNPRKKGGKNQSGEGVEEFIDDKPNFQDGEEEDED